MKFLPAKALAFALLFATCAAPVLAADDTVPDILQAQHALRDKLDNPNGEYSRFSPDDLTKMRQAQDEIFRMLAGVTSLDQLKEDQKVALSDELDEVKAALARNDANRLVCHREQKPGTNLVAKVCETVQEREVRTRSSE